MIDKTVTMEHIDKLESSISGIFFFAFGHWNERSTGGGTSVVEYGEISGIKIK